MHDRPFASSTLSLASGAAAALLFVNCALTLVSGTSQQSFETFAPPDAYARALVDAAPWLRTIVAIDDVFVAAYVIATLALAQALARTRDAAERASFVPWLVAAGGLAAGLSDLEENHHLLALLRAAESGVAIPVAEIFERTDRSQLKWMIGHLTFVLVGVALPARDAAGRALRVSLVAVQLPIGALAWAVPDGPLAMALLWVRYGALGAGFVAFTFLARARTLAGGAAIGSGAPA